MAVRKPKGKKKKYYTPPTALAKVRYRLTDGTPTHALLHYLHGRKKLPRDIRIIAEAAEKLHQVRELIDEVHGEDGVREVSKIVGIKFQKLLALVDGEAAKLIKSFMAEARKALVLKTMKEPEEG